LVLPDGQQVIFPIDPFSKTCLLNGVDQLGYLLRLEPAITAYEAKSRYHTKTGRNPKYPKEDRRTGCAYELRTTMSHQLPTANCQLSTNYYCFYR
jgi:hypothetical protein